MIKTRLLFLSLTSLLCLSGCFEQKLKIGVALPLSGKSTPRGQEILNAVLMAVDDVNRYGGVKGHKVEVEIQDDRDTPVQGRQAAQALISKQVLGVVGHYSSDVTLSVLPLYSSAKTALVSPSVSLSRIPSEGSVFFRTLGSNVQQAGAAASFIHSSGFRRVAIVHNASLYGQDLSECLIASLKEYPDIQLRLLEDDNDGLERIKRHLPELIFYAGGYQDAAQFLQKLRDNGLPQAFMGGNTLSDSEFIRQAGLSSRQIWLTAGGNPPADFFTRYRQRFGQPGPFTAYGYDAARLLLSAADQAKTLDAEGVRAELARRNFYQGITGPILLEPGNRATSRSSFGILEITPEGKFVAAQPIKPLFGKEGHKTGLLALPPVRKAKPPKAVKSGKSGASPSPKPSAP